jgi:hypothetical protein
MNPIFFMHIPKTAGTYLNRLFINALGSDRCAVHLEGKTTNGRGLSDVFELITEADPSVRFFSGHNAAGEIASAETGSYGKFTKITLLRDPVERTASQLRYMDWQTERMANGLVLPDDLTAEIHRVSATDFTSADSIEEFRCTATEMTLRLFENIQCRAFLRSWRTPKPVAESELPAAVALAQTFAAVVDQSDMQGAVDKIGAVTGIALRHTGERINDSPAKRTIDTENPRIRDVLARFVRVDQVLYDALRAGRLENAKAHDI